MSFPLLLRYVIWWCFEQTTYLFLSQRWPEIDSRKHFLDLCESEVQSAKRVCDITNIHQSTVYDNLKIFREGKELRFTGSGCKRIFDVNEQPQPKQIGDWRTTIVETWLSLEQRYRLVNGQHASTNFPIYTEKMGWGERERLTDYWRNILLNLLYILDIELICS